MADVQMAPVFVPEKNVMAQTLELRVPLYSHGCERKIKKALSHIRGLYSVDTDLATQKVTVVGIMDGEEVLAAVRSKRKNSSFWNSKPPSPSPPSPKPPSPQPNPKPKPNPTDPAPTTAQDASKGNDNSKPDASCPKPNPNPTNAPAAPKAPPRPKQPKQPNNNNNKKQKKNAGGNKDKAQN